MDKPSVSGLLFLLDSVVHSDILQKLEVKIAEESLLSLEHESSPSNLSFVLHSGVHDYILQRLN